ncbi:unnamed protein product [Vitrella brassicaformis CCMP3155]|uniref:alpha-1,3-mannosyl-glycoprotein 2-beta-N-acetylglucosaminyltransferase n=1 Tax=Vitrella brassicaformis (strain CCMP3155) TaxID=1169540 RepID=A0A0G4F9E8_VITBC|nr:unnamed protein product [Vitrella brassicaformis CCMP3155]|eukprot:CEM09491.1 unnamed protein product [Vitrella brassicaformis CCMP3155]
MPAVRAWPQPHQRSGRPATIFVGAVCLTVAVCYMAILTMLSRKVPADIPTSADFPESPGAAAVTKKHPRRYVDPRLLEDRVEVLEKGIEMMRKDVQRSLRAAERGQLMADFLAGPEGFPLDATPGPLSLLRLRQRMQGVETAVLIMDGVSMEEMKAIEGFRSEVYHMVHAQDRQVRTKRAQHFKYVLIAQHYYWAVEMTFERLGFEHVIIIEEDMEVSGDFFGYMRAAQPLLHRDPTLLCVSAWNDNGKASLVSDETALYRTDVFPGLGWMLSYRKWAEVRGDWPVREGYWDEWMRHTMIKRGYQCIRPEISRSYTFGEQGVDNSSTRPNHEVTRGRHRSSPCQPIPTSTTP